MSGSSTGDGAPQIPWTWSQTELLTVHAAVDSPVISAPIDETTADGAIDTVSTFQRGCTWQ